MRAQVAQSSPPPPELFTIDGGAPGGIGVGGVGGGDARGGVSAGGTDDAGAGGTSDADVGWERHSPFT
jgi:hypothetical protein